MNNFEHKLPTFEQAAWALDDRAIIKNHMPEEHTNIQVIEKADLTSASQSGWFNMFSDIAIDEQSIEDIYTHDLEYSQPSMTIPETEGAIESNLGYLSANLLPSTSVPDDQLLRGIRSTPIIILDSPDRDNSSAQGERHQRTDNSHKQNMNNSGHKLSTFEQAAWALDDRAIINHHMPEEHTKIQFVEKADLTSGSQSGWFNMFSDIAIDKQSIEDIYTHDLEYSQPSMTIPETEGAIESNLGYLSAKLLPSTSVPDEYQLLRGTISTPIIIPDSPDRDNSPAQGERRQSYHKRKRAREPESELEIMFSNPLNNMKKAKKMYCTRRNESQLPSIQNKMESKIFFEGWDGVQYVNGRMLIPLGRDLVLEELLSTTTVQENADHVSRELGPVSLPDSQDNYFSDLSDSSLQYATRCTTPSTSLKPQTNLHQKGFIEISLGE